MWKATRLRCRSNGSPAKGDARGTSARQLWQAKRPRAAVREAVVAVSRKRAVAST